VDRLQKSGGQVTEKRWRGYRKEVEKLQKRGYRKEVDRLQKRGGHARILGW
jgi:hypothetical protein